jgi:hypothetical protein
MIRGTTAQFKFVLPYDRSQIEKATIVFWQDGNDGTAEAPLPIYKSLEQCLATDNPREISVTLSKGETLRFSEKRKAYVQLTATTIEGTRFGSKQELITVYPIFDDSVLGDDITPTPGGEEENGWIILDGKPI